MRPNLHTYAKRKCSHGDDALKLFHVQAAQLARSRAGVAPGDAGHKQFPVQKVQQLAVHVYPGADSISRRGAPKRSDSVSAFARPPDDVLMCSAQPPTTFVTCLVCFNKWKVRLGLLRFHFGA